MQKTFTIMFYIFLTLSLSEKTREKFFEKKWMQKYSNQFKATSKHN